MIIVLRKIVLSVIIIKMKIKVLLTIAFHILNKYTLLTKIT